MPNDPHDESELLADHFEKTREEFRCKQVARSNWKNCSNMEKYALLLGKMLAKLEKITTFDAIILENYIFANFKC